MKYVIIFLSILSFSVASANTIQPIHKHGYVNKKVGDKYFVKKAQEQKENIYNQIKLK